VDEIVVLKPDKVERVFRTAADDADAGGIGQQGLDAGSVDGVEPGLEPEPDGNQVSML
jgi:hypothetical protein